MWQTPLCILTMIIPLQKSGAGFCHLSGRLHRTAFQPFDQDIKGCTCNEIQFVPLDGRVGHISGGILDVAVHDVQHQTSKAVSVQSKNIGFLLEQARQRMLEALYQRIIGIESI